MRIFKLYLAFTILVFLSSCEKKETISKSKGQVQFTMQLNGSKLKSTSIDAAKFISISIEKADGTPVFNTEKFELMSFNGDFLTKPIYLDPGDYMITKFIVLDANDNAIYATPKKDAPKAYLVKKPLDIAFSITTDVVTQVTPEVLSTENLSAKDFGYFDAAFQVVGSFDFLVSVFVYNETIKNFELVDATLTISGGSDVLYNLPLVNKTNKITVNDAYTNYTLKISKTGYADFIGTYTADSLKAFFDNPLVVILNKITIPMEGLVAYYPFNGNLNDESGKGNNGVNYSTSDTIGVKSGAKMFSSGYYPSTFKYLEIPNTINSSEFTLNFWVKVPDVSRAQNIFYLSNYNNWVTANFGLFIGHDGRFEIFINGLDLRSSDYSHDALVAGLFNSNFLNSTAILPNQAYNITLEYKSNTVKLYLNGQLDATYPNVSKEVGNLTKNIKLGVSPIDPSPYFSYPLTGWLDELRIYNRELTTNEILNIYNF